MRVKYFRDTDTALVEFNDKEVAETREVSEDILLDLDEFGDLVRMTIEHAKTSAKIKEFSYLEIGEESAA